MSLNCTMGESFYGPSLTAVCSAANYLTFMTMLDMCVQSNEKISGNSERITPVESPDDEYDFIVVGSGAAGAVIAARLSEIADWKVLLLEAGRDEPAGAAIPSFVGQFLATDVTWDYKTTNEINCQSTNGSCSWISGRNLGGNTVHNSMIYLRGNPTDYNNWAASGCDGWAWDDVKPYFLKSEDNGEIDRVGTEHHATGGPLSVARFSDIPPFGYAVFDAAEELGYGVSEDLNGDTLTGFAYIQSTNKNGVRSSTATAFLRPARNRPNLHVSLDSHVSKVIIKNDKAIGVEYYKNDELKKVYVTKEVILSAGVVGSSHLLLLSGIGPKEHLESVGVKVVKDLPGVGENLHDHPSTTLTFTINETNTYVNNWDVAAEYLEHQTGPMSGNGINPVTGLFASSMTTSDHPDIEINMSSHLATCAPGETDALQSEGLRTITVVPSYLHPKGRGRITLASNDPFDMPNIWANYLGHSDDIKGLVEAVQKTLALIDTDAMRRFNLTLSSAPLEACSDHEFLNDEYWTCAVHQIFYSMYHQAGSCKMGHSSDPMAVVDSQLRVHGIKGLRVADGSIIPKVTSCNTAAPIIMIGERAADFIKQDWDQ